MTDLTERQQDKVDEIVLDLQDEERRTEQAAAVGADDGCPYGEHCGNDCTGDHEEAVDCVHCECCTCTSCEYARVG